MSRRLTESERLFIERTMPTLCARNHKLLAEYKVDPDVSGRCDGMTVICAHCQHTALKLHEALTTKETT